MNKFIALYKSDLKNVRRDPILVYSIISLPIIMLVVRFFKDQILTEQFFAVAVLFTMFLGPIIFGMIPSFILLDEKDDKVLEAIRVLPVSTLTFLSYRMLNGVLLSFIYAIAAPYITSFTGIPLDALILCSILLALETPIVALMIMNYADNKVEGVAVIKIINAILMTPFLAYIISPEWSKILLPVPSYWPIKAFMEAVLGNGFLVYIIVGVVYYIGLLAVLLYTVREKVF